MTDQHEYAVAKDDYDQAVRQLSGQGYMTPQERLLCSIAASLLILTKPPESKQRRWPLRRAAR